MLPWVWITPALLLGKPDPAMARIERFLLIWAIVPLLFFSLSQAKADYYIAVCLPPLAGWMACRLGRLGALQRRRLSACAATAAALNLLVAVLLPIIAAHGSGRLAVAIGLLQSKGVLPWALAAVLVAAPAGAAWVFTTRWQVAATGLFALQTLVILAGVAEVAHEGVESYSSEPLMQVATATCGGDGPLMVYGTPEAVSAVLFYWSTDFRVVDSRSADFDFASRHGWSGQQPFLSSRDLRSWNQSPLCVIVPSGEAARFQRSGLAEDLQPMARVDSAVLWGNARALASNQVDVQ
jgi:4-amino-4-deoxy-L-arabinose transferase-like glycosyltransferase